MTREEAIALLNDQYETCKRIYDCSADQRKSYPNVPQFMEALDLALSALRPITREQAEKMRGEWVQVAYELAHLKCSECNHSINRFYGVSEFCPSCGAPMTDEAVDILWKRLEAMHNAD